jgi:PAS domain S-box-containing protein
METSDLPPDLKVLTEFLETDDRPTAVFSLDDGNADGSLNISALYKNTSFEGLDLSPSSAAQILKEFGDTPTIAKYSGQCRWVTIKGKTWNLRSVAQKWQVLVCRGQSQDAGDGHPTSLDYVDSPDSGIGLDRSSEGSNGVSEADHSINWIRFRIAGLSPWIEYVRTFDWASTPLGPLEDWPESLRGYILHIMSNPSPRLICWGSSMTIIYNEACIPLFGEKHPKCLGGSAPVMWHEHWDEIGPLLESTYQGNITRHDKMQMPMQRNGILEDTFWNCVSLPISGIHGDIIGLFLEFTEMTRLIIGERRRDSMMRLGQTARSAESLDALFSSYLQSMEGAKNDVPFALLYRVEHATRSSDSDCSESSPNLMKCVLEGTLAVPQDDTGLCRTFKLNDACDDEISHPLVKACVQAWKTRSAVTYIREDESYQKSLPTSVSGGPVEEQINTTIIAPITTIGSGDVLGILVTAVNPKCALDEEYRLYFSVLADILIRSSTLITLPQEQRRAQKIADEMNTALAQQLRLITLQAERMEAKFSRMAAEAPTGMFVYDREGRPLYVNDAYLSVLGETREVHSARSSIAMAWSEHIHPDDAQRFHDAWRRVLEQKAPLTIEYRLKKPWVSFDKASGQEISGDRWLLANAFPDVDSDGKISSIQGWLTDISHRKFTEALLSQKLEDALENKRQTENFIDMTSHEMRNPLSAIIQSADSIVSTLSCPGESIAITREVADEVVDAAETVILCAQHQKRIVDDILTLSKLDASLLIISPDRVQPPALLAKALKMYEAEITRAGIATEVKLEPTYEGLGVEWVILDPSRLLQVIINLLTNAVKFTQYAEHKNITIYLGASYDRPTGKHHKVSFIPTKHNTPANSPLSEWGDGEELFLQIAVCDTGRGLSDDEIKVMFQRFSQASPKTYSQYGGSGLGLFISRELCELQGGQIGVSSGNGKTTFTFFVRAKKWVPDAPPEKAHRPALPRFTSASASPAVYSRRGSVVTKDPSSAPLSRVGSIVEESPTSAGARIPSAQDFQRQISTIDEDSHKLHVLIVEDNKIK